jgi:hypothetical protein
VGAPIQWTASAADTQAGTLLYRWQLNELGQGFHIVRDYYSGNVYFWTPTNSEGRYQMLVTVQNQTTGEKASAVMPFTVTSSVTGATPVVLPTAHPLVALYSAPSCGAGNSIRVMFQTGAETPQYTPWKACTSLSSNFLIAGMRAGTTYNLVQQVAVSGSVSTGPALPFTTGALPASIAFPAWSVLVPPNANTAVRESVILQCGLNIGLPGAATLPVATDLSGNVIWYYPAFAAANQYGATMYRPLPGGTILVAANDTANPSAIAGSLQIFREIDLLGNTIRATNVNQVSSELMATGQDPIIQFNHDAIQLPNGHFILIASNERLLTNVQGPGTVDVIGNMLVELNNNLQVVWAWNAFDHLDTSREATLGETCTSTTPGCPPIQLASTANDWLHGNSINYDSVDGNLSFSLRHQDWVIKIDYNNRTGTGNVIWRLGNQGDFTLSPVPTDPYPWFSHQHDAEYDIQGKSIISLFDDGNVRKTIYPDADSRGQVYNLNESALTATQILSADLGTYSMALGSAQLLKNGNFFFGSGFIQSTSPVSNQGVEVMQNGTIDYVLGSTGLSYRNLRMYSLYQP